MTFRLLNMGLIVLALVIVGCGKDDDHSGHDHDKPAATEDSGHEHDEDMEKKGGDDDPFAALSSADAKLARAQKVCPVSDEELGSMGTPLKVMIGEKPVFLCCKGCRKKLLADPDKYLAKLK